MTFKCKYMDGCPMYNLITTSVRIIQLQPYLSKFCLSREDHSSCKRFLVIESGQEPPHTLLPDGGTLKA
jgi:hypothetical protein